jgi:PKD repeat protein
LEVRRMNKTWLFLGVIFSAVFFSCSEGYEPPFEPEVEELKASLFGSPTEGNAPLMVNFDASGSTGEIANFVIDFGDGVTSTQMKPSHEYSPGSFTALLTVFGEDGSVAYDSVSIEAKFVSEDSTNTAPDILFFRSSAASGPVPLDIDFYFHLYDADGDSIRFTLNYGDGTIITETVGSEFSPRFAHTYTEAANSYNPELLITDNRGGHDNASLSIETDALENNNPVIGSILPSASSIYVGELITIKVDAFDPDGDTLSYKWDFGDGNHQSGVELSLVEYTFTKAGLYNISVLLDDGRQGYNSANVSIDVLEPLGLKAWVRIIADHPATVVNTFNDLERNFGLTPTDWLEIEVGIHGFKVYALDGYLGSEFSFNFAEGDSIEFNETLYRPSWESLPFNKTVMNRDEERRKEFSLDNFEFAFGAYFDGRFKYSRESSGQNTEGGNLWALIDGVWYVAHIPDDQVLLPTDHEIWIRLFVPASIHRIPANLECALTYEGIEGPTNSLHMTGARMAADPDAWEQSVITIVMRKATQQELVIAGLL